jgi:hypothetical protein
LRIAFCRYSTIRFHFSLQWIRSQINVYYSQTLFIVSKFSTNFPYIENKINCSLPARWYRCCFYHCQMFTYLPAQWSLRSESCLHRSSCSNPFSHPCRSTCKAIILGCRNYVTSLNLYRKYKQILTHMCQPVLRIRNKSSESVPKFHGSAKPIFSKFVKLSSNRVISSRF